MRTNTLKPYLAVIFTLAWSIACVQAQFTFSHIGGGETGSITPNIEAGSYTMIGGGNDIWSASDEFDFAHTTISGDFDIAVRVESLEFTATWTKAGLMARETLAGNSRMGFNRVTPVEGANDSRFSYRTGTTSGGQGEHEDGSGAPGYPNAWLRLARVGNVITAYRGSDGVNWATQAFQDTATWEGGALPAALEVGFAVSRHSGADPLATCEFRNLQAAQIRQQPQSQTVDQGFTATFAIGLAGLADWTVQWRENGVDISGATGRSYTTAPGTASDTGKRYSARAVDRLSGQVFTSSEAVLTVVADQTPPTVVSAASAPGDGTVLNVVFSEPVNKTDAENLANYSLPGITLNSAALQADNKTVRFSTSDLYGPGCKILTVNNVRDRAIPPNTMASTVIGAITAKGSIRYLQYNGITGTAVANLTSNAKYPNSADRILNVPDFENPERGGNHFNDYGSLFQGFVHPPVSGAYTFYLASDDNSTLWLSTDENPANKVQIAMEPQWAGYREWTGNAGGRRACPGGACENISRPITLQAGCKYFVEYIYKEGGGGDYGSVTWQLPGAPIPGNGSNPILGNFLSPYEVPATIPAGQPADITQLEGRYVTFTANISGSPNLAIQWYRDGVAIAGANGNSITLGPVRNPEDDGATFYVTAQNSLGSATSRTATLHVTPDNDPPQLASAAGSTTFDRVTVTYNEIVDAQSAGDEFSYSISDGVNALSIIAADLLADGKTVLIVLDPTTPLQLDTTYTVTAQGISDLAGNVMDTGTASFHSAVEGCGGIVFEAYNTSDQPGNAVSILTGHPTFPNSPDFRMTIPGLDSRLAYPTDAREQYGARMRGVYVPPYSGAWILYLRSDDASELWFNPNGISAAGKERVQQETGCCQAFEALPTRAFDLVGGRPYYIEVLYKEGGGGDYGQVAARPLGSSDALVPIGARDVGQYAEPGFSGSLTVSGPTDQTVLENRVATFSITASSSEHLPICYQWFRDGSPITGANNSSYSLRATLGDNGAVFTARASIVGNVVNSAAATLTVTADTVAPKIVSASGTDSLRNVIINFDEQLDAQSAGDEFNYSVAGLTVEAADLMANGSSVKLTTSEQTQCTVYTVTVTGVKDTSQAGNAIGSENVNFTSWKFSPGFLKFDYYNNMSTADNGLDTTLLADPRYPDSPTTTYYISAFDSRTVFPDDSHEGYAARVSGAYVPSTSGNWLFYLASDDSSRLFLNAAGYNPNANVLIDEEPGCCGIWTSHISGPQALTAGTAYSIAGIYKEGTGGDYLKVAAGLEGTPAPPDNPNQQRPVSVYAIAGQNIGVMADCTTGASGRISRQPTDTTACINPLLPAQEPVTISLAVETAPAGVASYVRWERLSGGQWVWAGNGTELTLSPSLADNGTKYRASLYVLGLPAPIVSNEITLSVFQANTPPTFDLGSSDSAVEDSGAHSVPGFASNVKVHSIPRNPVAFSTAFNSAAGFTLYGNPTATIADGVLKLTTPVNSAYGAAALTAPQQTYESLEVSWKSLIGGGSDGADGYSLSIGDALAGDPGYGGEEGKGDDLIIAIDTFNNAELRPGGVDDGIGILWGGNSAFNNELAFQHIPKNDDGSGVFLRKNQFVDAKVTVDASGLVTFTYDGNTISGQIPNYTGVPANRVLFWGRTGGANDNHWIDDLDIKAFPFDRSSAESAQHVHFEVSNSNPAAFSQQPAISDDGTLTYAVAPNACTPGNPITVTVVARDDGGTRCNGDDASDPKTFTITIQCVNDCPAATSSSYSVVSGGKVAITLTGTDVDGDALTASVTSNPHCGTLAVENGQLTYTANVTSTECHDSFTFSVSDGTCTATGGVVSVTVIPNKPPVCVGKISPGECGVTFPHNGKTFAIAVKKDYVCLALDSSGSSDPDGDALTTTWIVDGTNMLSGTIVTNCMDIGCHTIIMIVSDGKTTCQQMLGICVIEPSEAVEQLIAQVESTVVERKNKRPLLVSLKAAKAAFDRDGWRVGAQMLRVFEFKVQAQIARRNPAEAAAFIQSAENIITAVKCVIKQPRKHDHDGHEQDDGDDDDDHERESDQDNEGGNHNHGHGDGHDD